MSQEELSDSLSRLQANVFKATEELAKAELTSTAQVRLVLELLQGRRTATELVESLYGVGRGGEGFSAHYYQVTSELQELESKGIVWRRPSAGGSFEGRFYKMWREDTDLYSFWLMTSEGKSLRLRASSMHGETSLVSCVYDKASDEWSLVLDHAPIYDYDSLEWVPAGFVSGTVLIERL